MDEKSLFEQMREAAARIPAHRSPRTGGSPHAPSPAAATVVPKPTLDYARPNAAAKLEVRPPGPPVRSVGSEFGVAIAASVGLFGLLTALGGTITLFVPRNDDPSQPIMATFMMIFGLCVAALAFRAVTAVWR